MEGSLFSKLAHRLKQMSSEVYPFHVGDTWLEPAAGCRMEDLSVTEHPGMHRYAPPHGLPLLLDRLVARHTERTGVATEPDNVLVAAGATGALGAAAGATLDAGEEVLVLAPFWPLIAGILKSVGAVPVAVPFVGVADSPEQVADVLAEYATDRTAAIYVSTPNNPSGRVISPPIIDAVARWATDRGLWVLADEVYEDYLYTGEHCYCRALAPERTFSVHSFSKAYGMAGNRCGYVVGPADTMTELRKISVHSFYSTPTASQIAAARALDGRGDEWIAAAKPIYEELGRDAAKRLGHAAPEGSQFLWLDVAERLDDRGLMGFLEDCLEDGLLVAPGPSFGPYPSHVRICYTAASPEITRRGIEVLASHLGR